MRNTNRQILIFSLAIILLCFLSVIIFTIPSFIQQLNLTTKSNIGGAIGGITAPVIGIISSILLYLALTKQVKSISEQRLKNESDIIFLLITQLENELSSFYHKYKERNESKMFIGFDGLNEFSQGYRYEYNIKQFENNPQMTIKTWFEAGQIALFVDTFNLINKRIEISNLSNEMKHLFIEKLNSYYACKLSMPLTALAEAFEMYPQQKDELSARITMLVNSRKK